MNPVDLSRARWRTSSYSAYNGNCVEVAPTLHRVVAVRDSKRPDDGAIAVTREAFAALVRTVK